MTPAIDVLNVSKVYRRYARKKQFATLKSAILDGSLLGDLKPEETFQALKGVSFSVPKGCTYGVIGRNGSGKSTLLKLIAAIHRPTEGRVLVARHARIDGDTVIRAHTVDGRMPMPGQPDQAARGADGMKDGDNGGNGAPGGAGAAGEEGAASGKVVLRIGEVSGNGRLIVDMSGQAGGKGQNGGQGGDGGNGRNGRARACGGDEPQNGGDGGWGGIGGQGGQGGRGGNGGIVAYSAALAPLIKSKHFIVKTAAGAAGAGGNPGQPGNPGSGGLGGAGAIGCGAGGSDGAQGGQTSGAQPGKAGSPGTNGTSLQEQAP